MPGAKIPLYSGSPLDTAWLMNPLVPLALSAMTGVVTSPPTLNVSLPDPPSSTVTTPGSVLRTSKVSLPPRPSTSILAMLVYDTFRPAPMIPSLVITNVSLPWVPMTTSVL